MSQCKYEMLRPCHIRICPPLHSALCQGTDTISTFDILSLAVTDRVVLGYVLVLGCWVETSSHNELTAV